MIKHPMARIISGGLLTLFLIGSVSVATASQTLTVSAENNSINEQTLNQEISTSHSLIGVNKVLYSALNTTAKTEEKVTKTVTQKEEVKEINFDKKGYTTTSVNVRKSHSVDSKKLETYNINTKIKYTDYNDEWVQIKYKKGSAFMAKKYISNKKTEVKPVTTYEYSGSKLTRSKGVNQGPSGKETYYNLPMNGVIRIMRNASYNYTYWVRDDGVKMYGDYVMIAADLSIRPRGSLVPTSLGMGIVCDTGTFIYSNQTQIDIAVTW